MTEADAWQQFDGELGMDFCRYMDNEQWRAQFRARNPSSVYKDWVEPLITPKTLREKLLSQISHLVDVTLIDEVDNSQG